MKCKWRIYADNDIEREIVGHVRRCHVDVVWVADEPGLSGHMGDAFHFSQARRLGCYLLTHDLDFWDDRRLPLAQSSGLIMAGTRDPSVAKWLPVALRKILRDYDFSPESLRLDGVKVKLGAEGFVLKFVDPDAGRTVTESFSWSDLV